MEGRQFHHSVRTPMTASNWCQHLVFHPIFFNYSWIIMRPKIFSRDKLSPETHCVYVFVICWPLMNLIISNSHKQNKEKKVFNWNFVYTFYPIAAVKIIRHLNAEEFCIFKNIAASVINFGRRLCSSFLYFSIFYAKL